MDLRKIKTLISLMQNSDISELELEEEGMAVRLRKGKRGQGASKAVSFADRDFEFDDDVVIRSKEESGAPPAQEDGSVIPSPIVGTFYASPKPGADPFVAVGQKVDPETVICIVEAMKVMNEIKAGVSGTISQVLVENGEPVEFDQPLFRVQ